jgi:hypothetical protein
MTRHPPCHLLQALLVVLSYSCEFLGGNLGYSSIPGGKNTTPQVQTIWVHPLHDSKTGQTRTDPLKIQAEIYCLVVMLNSFHFPIQWLGGMQVSLRRVSALLGLIGKAASSPCTYHSISLQ